ncbi:DNA-directed RNA polymerase subunit alpha C-terminal domain-containing protein [Paraburkholderia adhaesiva]|uniref:DNA-directed RNA polymerase subunit alpha C-terminal domain-containing protein n=1 Tax=Paraburkholderia adhaesiva TaxID=2883244 RepID=UPI001F45ABC1|nr:DNA-directed RNA polymerase subunit alpha C-terminal domain-containing protein [Paraburkholderia adhaesiva]
MRIVIETTGELADLARARNAIDAMLAPRAVRVESPESIKARGVSTLALSPRTFNLLAQSEVLSVADLCRRTRADLLRIPNFGRGALNEVTAALAARGLCLASGTGGRDE